MASTLYDNESRLSSEASSFSEVSAMDTSILQSGGGDLAISGYLLKKSKDGIWQRRYFETNGNYLTYYKNKKMTKLLAALCLDDVGEISVVGDIQDILGAGVIFQIELKDRNYLLRAQTRPQAEQWVNMLQAIKASSKPGPPTDSTPPHAASTAPTTRNLSIDDSVGSGNVKLIDAENKNDKKASSCCCGWF